jgi:phage terminase large subunit GpA-like protein
MSGEWKRLYNSTPTIKGASRIDSYFAAGDQRHWHMDCPGCGKPFRFIFDRAMFRFEETYPYKAHYVVPCCGTIIEGHEKVALMKSGWWIALDPKPGAYPSYHFDALTSPFVPWDKIAERYVKAKGDPQKLKTFENLTLGLAFDMKGDAPDHVRLMERRAPDLRRGHIPAMGLVLVGAADVQAGGIWYVIKAYGPDRQSWRVDAGFLEGGTDDPHGGAFLQLEEIRTKRWPDAYGGSRPVDAFGVDSGFRAHVVYTFVRGKPGAFALKGMDGWSRPAIGQPSMVDIDFMGKRIRQGAAVWPVGTWSLKGAFYADLRKQGMAAGKESDPPGYCHFGKWMDENYFLQITSEYLASENYKGRVRKVWKVRSGAENHLLDCEIYGAALADYVGVSRMTQDEWLSLASQRAAPDVVSNPDMFAPEPIAVQQRTVAEAPAPEAPNRRNEPSYWD